MPTVALPYTDADMSVAISEMTPTFGELAPSGLFSEERISTSVVQVRREGDTIVALPAVERGGPATEANRLDKDAIFLPVPHIPHRDTLRPEEIQDMQDVDGSRITFEAEFSKRLARMRRRHDITHEYMAWLALTGRVVDGANAVIHDLYAIFGITKKTVNFFLTTAGTDVLAKCEEVYAHIEDNLKGEVMTGVEARVSPEFFNALIAHAKVEKYYVNYVNAMQIANAARVDTSGQTTGRIFLFGNILFREKRGTISTADGQSSRFMAANRGVAMPTGAGSTFAQVHAPPTTRSGVNRRPSELITVTTQDLPHDAGVEFKTQSNPMFLAKRPALLVDLQLA